MVKILSLDEPIHKPYGALQEFCVWSDTQDRIVQSDKGEYLEAMCQVRLGVEELISSPETLLSIAFLHLLQKKHLHSQRKDEHRFSLF